MRVGVVGAGISGLLCAQRLAELVPTVSITVFEWGRGPGGRMARRRVEVVSGSDDNLELSFDHAAPYFSATTDAFRNILAHWQAAGVTSPWPEAGDGVWVGVPSSNAIARHLVSELKQAGASLCFGCHVLDAQHDGTQWVVRAQDRTSDATLDLLFDALVLSDKLLVLPNTYSVLAPADIGPLAVSKSLSSTGCVVLLIALKCGEATVRAFPHLAVTSVINYSTDNADTAHPIIARVVHDSAKPGRPGSSCDQWVVHTTTEYAAAHLDGESLDDAEAVLAEIQAAFLAIANLDQDSSVLHASVMVWDHAQPTVGSRVTDAAYRIDVERSAGVCGDFFGSDVEGVEAAALSGTALAEELALQCFHVKSDL